MPDPLVAEPDVAALASTLMHYPRVARRLEVKVWGIDADKKMFSQSAQTMDISRAGARVAGMRCQIQLGEIVYVQYNLNKARCRVVWQGEKGTAEEGQIGVLCVDEIFCPWISCIPISMSPTSEVEPAGGSWPQKDRRRFPRYRCNGTIRVRKAGDTVHTDARITDIGLGGCYVEVMAPWPVETVLEAVISVGHFEFAAVITIRTAHPLMGNGVEFTAITPENKLRLERILSTLAAVGGGATAEAPAAAQASNQPVPNPLLGYDAREKFEALLSILERRGVVTAVELEEELKRRGGAN